MTDQELVSLVMNEGSRGAFGILYERHNAVIFHQIRNYTQCEDLAYDMVAMAFEKALKKLLQKEFRNGSFGGWVNTIAYHCFIDHVRKRKKRTVVPLWDAVDESSEGLVADFESRDEAKALDALIRKLSPKQQEFFFLRYVMGFRFREIADLLGESTNTITGRSRYVLINLRKLGSKESIF